MKRRLIPGLMLAITLSFAGCTDQLVSPIQENDIIVDDAIEVPSQVADGDPYQVLVESNETKTITEQGTNGKWSTYWVDAASASQNARSGPDMINLFSKKTGSQDYKSHGKFTYVGNQTFDGNLSGGLEDLGDSNDWYSIYPFNENSSSAATGITARVVIGASSANEYTQEQNGANSMSHLAGDYYPMYGIKNNVAKNKTPKFKMSHLYSIVALKIVNEGDGGDIIINRAEFSVSGSEEMIIGEFNVNVTGDAPIYSSISGNTSNVAKLALNQNLVIAKGEDNAKILYLAIKPFDASGKTIDVIINGSARRVKMPANIKFEAGKITTLRIPVKALSFGRTTNDLLSVKATYVHDWELWTEKTDAITLSSKNPQKMIVNGKEVDAFVLGTETNVGSVTIKGTAKELMPYLPLGFYVTSWDKNTAVMRVESIKGYFWLLKYIGISFSYNELAGKLMAAERITFKGVVPIEQYTDSKGIKHLTILDEEPVHKSVSETQINNLLANFDDVLDDGYSPTFEGLQAAITNPSSIMSGDYTLADAKTQADITAHIIYHKIFSVLHSPSNAESLGKVAGIAELIFSTPKTLFETVASLPIKATLQTVPKGTDGATDNRIVVWGLSSSN